MQIFETVNPLFIVTAITGLLSIYYLLGFLFAIKKLKAGAVFKRLVFFSIFTSVTLIISFYLIGTLGYKALTHEIAAADLSISPNGEQTFHTRMEFPDGSHQIFQIDGDQLMVDAYILKWKPWTNVLGLKTAYRLDRIRGRYNDINEEKSKPASIYAINSKSNKGIAQWREDYKFLSFLLDVEHGSASFVSAEVPKELQLSVTTSGLVLRPKEQIDN